jgi:hypothetical protein
MALVQIFSYAGLEIEYKKDSLTLKKENNSLSSDFKVPHSSFPFLVIENEVTKNVLGPSDITSIRKNKIIPVTILENGVRYYGELQQLSVIPKFRKCNLKYGSKIIEIQNKKIADFMPIVSVIPGETNPVSYSEESNQILLGIEHWENYPVQRIGQIFPEAKFNFPMISWFQKYGADLELNDEWYEFKNHINNFMYSANAYTFLLNTFNVTSNGTTFINRNVPVPHLFLLAPLHYIFSYLGWTISGNFTTHELIRRLMLVPKNDNICSVPKKLQQLTYGVWEEPIIDIPGLSYEVHCNIFPTVEGVYNFDTKFVENFFVVEPGVNPSYDRSRLEIQYQGIVYFYYEHVAGTPATIYTKKFSVNVDTVTVQPIGVTWFVEGGNPDVANSFVRYDINSFEKPIKNMHPTIQLGRYAPDWTVGNYLNYIKNQFNLDITLDDFNKSITLNLNENIFLNETPAIVSQSLTMKSYDIAANSSFILKYKNNEDDALYISQDEIVSNKSSEVFTKTIESDFKILPRNAYTSELSEEVNEKEGVGLVIYTETSAPYTAEATQNGFNLKIPGTKGIYDTFFKRWLKFLLNASNCEVTGYFTAIEISKINKVKAVYINNQRFRIIDIETTEASNNYQEVKMKLLSVNY